MIEKLGAKYSADGPEVLHQLSLTIHSGEKVGVVGRTGSGKSSLTLSLLRLIPTSGEVLYDGRPTSQLNLEDLRRAITIIPQQPELIVSLCNRPCLSVDETNSWFHSVRNHPSEPGSI